MKGGGGGQSEENMGGHMRQMITSVSSCTSSMVGHGSAICARGIFSLRS